MEDINCIRRFSNDLVLYDNNKFSEEEFEKIDNAKYHSYSYLKNPVMENNDFTSLYFMNENLKEDKILSLKELFDNSKYGNVIRIKGFYKKGDKWFYLNMTKNEKIINEISCGQDVIIVIGSNLDEENIRELL